MNKFILNADDFGMSKAFNDAVLDGCKTGLLQSASICSNGDYFDDAIERVLASCPNLSLGVHLNIIEGRSLSGSSLLCDSRGNFNNSYGQLLVKSFNSKFIDALEAEFRIQIEKALNVSNISHIDSHVHTHSIPRIFELSAKLAKEYKIPYIRTQAESFYLVYINKKFLINIIKNILLNFFTLINRKTVSKYNLKTNDYLIGVLYTSMMDDKTLLQGIKKIKNKDKLIEALIHPCNYSTYDNHYREFLTAKNIELMKKIENLNIAITNYNSL